ncbi:MAG: DedA family protein [Ktedonobacteraceae bacterium]
MHSIMHALLHIHPLLIYLLVAVILLLESSGIPITNNTMLLLTGAMASLGYLNIGMLIVSAILGSIAGACCAYWIGARGGQQILLRLATFFHADEKKIHTMDGWLHTSGCWMIFFSRMTPFVRPFACFPAGISHMHIKKFLFAASAGSIIWCTVLPLIGWTLGHRWEIALYFMQRYTLLTLLVVTLLLVLYGVITSRIKRFINAKYRSLSV